MAIIMFDIEDYLDEADTEYLVKELQSRSILPKSFKYGNNENLTSRGKNPKRDSLLNHLGMSHLASLEDVLETVKINYYK